MSNGVVRALCFGLVAGLLLVPGGCSRERESSEVRDVNSVRAELKEQVDGGKLTKEEAIVRLAEATRDAKLGPEGKTETKLSAGLEVLSKELKEQVAKGELTEEEAKAAWQEAAKEAGSKEIKDPAKGTE
jgi:polyhydroxyalkanoate synthesis regulator phasin